MRKRVFVDKISCRYSFVLTADEKEILSETDDYVVRSNRESGNGRSDLFAKPVSRKDTAYIIEVKVAKTYDGLEHAADEALAQIVDKKYDEEMKADGYYDIVHYGIAFFG